MHQRCDRGVGGAATRPGVQGGSLCILSFPDDASSETWAEQAGTPPTRSIGEKHADVL